MQHFPARCTGYSSRISNHILIICPHFIRNGFTLISWHCSHKTMFSPSFAGRRLLAFQFSLSCLTWKFLHGVPNILGNFVSWQLCVTMHISWTIQPSTELVLLHKAKSVRQTSQSTQGYSQGRTWVLSIGGTGNVMQSTTQIFGCGCGSVDNRERMWWEEGASHESLKSKLQTFSAEEHFFSDFYSLYKASTASLPLPPYYLL